MRCTRLFLPPKLEAGRVESGISLTTPYFPKEILQSLPPMLRTIQPTPTQSYSKAPGVFSSFRS